ncbi:MAG: SagB/ThcOx family dehydrogenase [Thermodesulfobacteriota bacterium]
MPELHESLGFRYLQESKFHRGDERMRLRPAIAETETFKTYPEAATVELPRTWPESGPSLPELLQQRRTLRRFGERPLTLHDLALLLWASQGITGQAGNYLFRTAPSAGALYPMETYLVSQRVEGLAPGLYHFDVRGFRLEHLGDGPDPEALSNACLEQGFMRNAAVNFLWTAVVRRTMSKYGHRALRYICMDMGHLCQNLLLAAEYLGFGGCPMAAFYDDEVNRLLGVDGEEETALYLASVGAKRA